MRAHQLDTVASETLQLAGEVQRSVGRQARSQSSFCVPEYASSLLPAALNLDGIRPAHDLESPRARFAPVENSAQIGDRPHASAFNCVDQVSLAEARVFSPATRFNMVNQDAGNVLQSDCSPFRKRGVRIQKRHPELKLRPLQCVGLKKGEPLSKQRSELITLRLRKAGHQGGFVGEMLWNHFLEQRQAFLSEGDEDRPPILLVGQSGDEALTFQRIDPEAHTAGGAQEPAHQIPLDHPVWPSAAPKRGEHVKRCPRDTEFLEFGLQRAIHILHDSPGAANDFNRREVVIWALAFPVGNNRINMILNRFHTRTIVCGDLFVNRCFK